MPFWNVCENFGRAVERCLHLRKISRILSIGNIIAIEGNRLSPSQVRDVINGKPVLGLPKDITVLYQ